MDLVCTICGRDYIYERPNKAGHTKTKCNSCSVNIRRFDKKIKAVAYMGGKCVLCGYDRFSGALQFHHLDPSSKGFGVSGRHCFSWEKLKQELDKCVLLCSNCHAELHGNYTKLPREVINAKS